MRSSRALIAIILISATWVGRAQQTLPPLSYVCPMPQDADVIEDKPGTCPKCGMRLQTVRFVSVWTCPIHAAVIKEAAGTCPLDGRRLIQVTMAESWTCPGDSKGSMEPGSCPDGSARKKTFAARPHGNHNPQHGGEFFMAPDNWHHLEGTYPSTGLFRVYLYDDYTKPLSTAKVREIAGRVTTANGQDIPLARNGRVLEARVGKAALPLTLHAHVRFEPDGVENLFDFTFAALTTDTAPIATTATASRAPSVPAAPMGTPTPTGIKLGLSAAEIPTDVAALLKGLRDRSNQIAALITQGQYGMVYVAAFEAKDLALSLDAKNEAAPSNQHTILDTAISQLVRDTYLLDAYGDLGNGQRISATYADFAGTIDLITRTVPQGAK